MFLETGYGLEGVLPDGLCKRIIDEQITPRFKAGDFDGGLTAGVQSILAATRGEYKGTGTTVAEGRGQYHGQGGGSSIGALLVILVVVVIILSVFRRLAQFPGILFWGGGWSGGGSSSGWSSGGGFGGGFGGGGFSGGGGSFGGGGAGGSW